jgi:3-oxoacyl-[acyl-carrier protein] reductase
MAVSHLNRQDLNLFYTSIPDMKVQNKVVIITGASRGLGKELALKLAKERARVVMCARNLKDLIVVKKQIIKKYKGECLAIDADVSDEEDVRRLFSRAMVKFGHVDMVICNAGLNVKKPFFEITEDEWNSVIDTNTKGVFLCTKEAYKHMDRGKIAVISSVAGMFGAKNYSLYCASKHAIEGFVKGAKKDMRKPIDVKVFHPYRLDTSFHKNYRIKSPESHMISPGLYADYVISTLMGRPIASSLYFIRNEFLRALKIIGLIR